MSTTILPISTGYGPIINSTQGLATTIRQIGGTGLARWKQLAYGAHLQGAWNTVEYVTLLPGSSIGEHLHDRTEEIYYIIEGQATMWMNGRDFTVNAGDLITTPIGYRHAIVNSGNVDMTFYVTEVFPGADFPKQSCHVHMQDLLMSAPGPHEQAGVIRSARVELAELFTGPWRAFSKLELEPAARLGDYTLGDAAEVVFVLDGTVAITVEGNTYESSSGTCVALPAGAARSIENIAGDIARLIATEVAIA